MTITAHHWQGYGYYADAPGKPVWAGVCKASNEYMAHTAMLARCHPQGPVIWSLKRIIREES